MPIPTKKIKVGLLKIKPSEISPENMKLQLNNIGLTCEHTSLDVLKQSIAEVKSQFAHGFSQSYGINSPQKSTDGSKYYKSIFEPGPFLGLEPVASGEWEPSDTGMGYTTELSWIQFPSHFDYLLQNKHDFTGQKGQPVTYTGKFDTVDAIKNLYVNAALDASSLVTKGLDKASMTAVLYNIISPMTEAVHNYDVNDSRIIFIVDDYDPVKQEAQGIGVLTVDWRLFIQDYKKKKSGLKHDTVMTICARAVEYDKLEQLMSDFNFIKTNFKENAFNNLYYSALKGIPVTNKVEIFDTLPPPNKDTFEKSLPLISKENKVEVIVLYAPDLNNIGCFDNSNSDAESKYSKSVTSGFTYSTSQTLSTEFSFEASGEIIKAGFKIGFSVTFSEAWNTSTTETIEFTIPAGKKAFTYQGYLKAATLQYIPETNTYKYIDYAKFITNNLTTTRTPIEQSK